MKSNVYPTTSALNLIKAYHFFKTIVLVQVRPFLSISKPSLRLFAHYLCLMCFNPGTTWNVDEDGTLYFARAEDPRFKVEEPYIR